MHDRQLEALEEQGRREFLKHAAQPRVQGPWKAHRKLWALHYEVRAAVRDQNPGFAKRLLPKSGAVLVQGPGLPLRPAGVRWAVDEEKPGTLTLTVDVAGVVGFSIVAPGGKTPTTPPVTFQPTRATSVFAALSDGLYRVNISVGGTPLTVLYVPVQRAEFARFRENSRALAHAFQVRRPLPNENFEDRLAWVIAAEAAAATAQPELFAQCAAAAAAVPEAKKPTALFPRHG